MTDCKPKMPSATGFVLATDLDGTFIPLADDRDSQQALRHLHHALGAASVGLVFVTGRHLASVQQAMERASLPQPQWIIGDVGTAIYAREKDEFVPLKAYEACLRERTRDISSHNLRPYFADIPGLRPQDEAKQGPFKLSYDVDADRCETLASALASCIRKEDLPYHPVVSVDPFTGDGLIDLLPLGVTKAFALQWLVDELGIDSEKVVFAGDSGNDYAALVSGFKAILVGNAADDLRQSVRSAHREAGWEGRLYLATGQSTCGVLEGLRHYGLLDESDPRLT